MNLKEIADIEKGIKENGMENCEELKNKLLESTIFLDFIQKLSQYLRKNNDGFEVTKVTLDTVLNNINVSIKDGIIKLEYSIKGKSINDIDAKYIALLNNKELKEKYSIEYIYVVRFEENRPVYDKIEIYKYDGLQQKKH